MPEILRDKPLVKTTNEEYGEAIRKMKANNLDSIKIPKKDREKFLMFVRRKYGNSRRYSTRTVGKQLRLYRLK